MVPPGDVATGVCIIAAFLVRAWCDGGQPQKLDKGLIRKAVGLVSGHCGAHIPRRLVIELNRFFLGHLRPVTEASLAINN